MLQVNIAMIANISKFEQEVKKTIFFLCILRKEWNSKVLINYVDVSLYTDDFVNWFLWGYNIIRNIITYYSINIV